jgi:hypothetical protein
VKLKKAAVVTAATAGLVLGSTPAFAAPSADEAQVRTVAVASADRNADDVESFTFANAFYTFIEGGGALGYGAAALIAGAYAGIALTPALIAGSFSG